MQEPQDGQRQPGLDVHKDAHQHPRTQACPSLEGASSAISACKASTSGASGFKSPAMRPTWTGSDFLGPGNAWEGTREGPEPQNRGGGVGKFGPSPKHLTYQPETRRDPQDTEPSWNLFGHHHPLQYLHKTKLEKGSLFVGRAVQLLLRGVGLLIVLACRLNMHQVCSFGGMCLPVVFGCHQDISVFQTSGASLQGTWPKSNTWLSLGHSFPHFCLLWLSGWNPNPLNG